MKKSLLFYSLLAFVIGLGLTSCSDKEDYWVDSNLDMTFLLTTNNTGYFEPSAMYEFSLFDLTKINHSKEDIREIRLTDTWIEIKGDFIKGDEISGLEIYIEGIGKHRVPKQVLSKSGYFVIDNVNSPGLFNFMADAMDKLNYTGKVYVTCSGFHNVPKADIDIIIRNDVKVLVSN